MATSSPYTVRIEKETLSLLKEGIRRTPHKKQELMRITLRRYLLKVIEEESLPAQRRITNVDPWPKKVERRLYGRKAKTREEKEWEKVEEAAVRAQGKPDFDRD